MAELFAMWRNTRMVVLTAICAALYAAILIPFKVIPLIPGITEFRPANAVPVVCSFLFGPAGAWGAAFGNLIGDFFGGLGPGDLFGFFANLLYGLVPYLVWEAITTAAPRGWGRALRRDRAGQHALRRGRRLGAQPARLPSVHGARHGRAGEQPRRRPRAEPAAALGPLPAHPPRPSALPGPARTAAAPRAVARGARRVARRRGDRRDVRRRRADRRRPLARPLGAAAHGLGRLRGRCGARPAARGGDRRARAAVTAAVSVRGLTCTYAGASHPALADVDLEVPPGALVVVMGATGAGKSTLARCLTRIVPCFTPAEVRGDVRLCGIPVDGRRPGELAGTVGMVFQDFEAQLFSTDVTQEIVFGLEHTGVPPAEMPTRVRQALAAVGLAGFEARDPGTLSGGEKQRLAIAALLALRPRVMILDEPTTDLDPAGRAEVWQTLAALRAEGIALIVIEHDPAAAAAADLVVLLEAGRVAARGTPAALLTDVGRCARAGVRAADVPRLFAALGLRDPPLDVATAAARLRARGLVPRPPAPPEPPPRPPLLVVEG